MQKIIYRVGSLFDHPGLYLLQGCNARGEMNTGVAETARKLYPKNWEVYRAAYEEQDNKLYLGQVIVADCERFMFLNAITQDEYGYDGAKYVSEEAIQLAIQSCNLLMYEKSSNGQLLEIAMPRVGAGLAGGDWNIISKIIEQTAENFIPVVYVQDANLIPKN